MPQRLTLAAALIAVSTCTAVRSGDVKAVQKVIEEGGDVNAKNEYGVSALGIAAGKPKIEVVQLLVSKGADVNVRDDIWYQTPLSSADRKRGRSLFSLDLIR